MIDIDDTAVPVDRIAPAGSAVVTDRDGREFGFIYAARYFVPAQALPPDDPSRDRVVYVVDVVAIRDGFE